MVDRDSERLRERVRSLFDRLRASDPDLVLAADEQDASLLDWFAGLTIAE